MSVAVLAHHLASKGRNGDSMLVHMSPHEVAGLHALAVANGKNMTINPETGLPEAFDLGSIFKAVLPAIAGIALGPAGLGIASSALGAGAMVGGATALATGSLQRGIMAGLGAYGGYGLGEALAGAGANAVGTAGALGVPGASSAAGSQAAMLAEQNAGFGGEGLQRLAESAAKAQGATPSLSAAYAEGAKAAMDNPLAFAKSAAKPLFAAAAPIMADLATPTTTKMPTFGTSSPTAYITPFAFNQYTGGLTSLGRWKPEDFPGFGSPTYKAASGGIVALADGGTPTQNPMQMASEAAKQYFAQNPDVAAAYQKETYGLTPEQFANAHYVKYGAIESRPITAAEQAGFAWGADPALAYRTAATTPTTTATTTTKPITTPDYSKEIAQGQQAIPYATGTAATDAEIQNIYQQLLRRQADPGGLAFYAASKWSPEQIRQQIMKSDEFRNLPAFVDEPAPTPFTPTTKTMQETVRDYTQGGGQVAAPSVQTPEATARVVTQNAVVNDLQAYLAAHPNATMQELQAWGLANGVPMAQLSAAINERRFNQLTGGSKAAYDYLMGRGAYPVNQILPGGAPIAKPYLEASGLASTFHPVYFTPSTTATTTAPDTVTGGVFTDPNKKPDIDPGPGMEWSWDDANRQWLKKVAIVNANYGGLMALADGGDVEDGGVTTLTPKTAPRVNPLSSMQDDDLQAAYDKATKTQNVPQQRRLKTEMDLRQRLRSVQMYAHGGMSKLEQLGILGGAEGGHLGGYSDGGRLLRGPGDGVSDSIPATIGDRQPARLADGEFVVPARIVSEIGNGSTEAGARKLYAMMDRVQRARAKTTGKGKVAKDTSADQYLPA